MLKCFVRICFCLKRASACDKGGVCTYSLRFVEYDMEWIRLISCLGLVNEMSNKLNGHQA
jgi:hypothetical protein